MHLKTYYVFKSLTHGRYATFLSLTIGGAMLPSRKAPWPLRLNPHNDSLIHNPGLKETRCNS